MPDQETVDRAERDKEEGKSPSTQAGEFVREEMDHIREGKHGARSTKQAIAIGLSKARRAGVDLPPNPSGKGGDSKKSSSKSRRGSSESSAKRARASTKTLRREGSRAASKKSLSRFAKATAKKRGAAARSKSARKAAKTRSRGGKRSGR